MQLGKELVPVAGKGVDWLSSLFASNTGPELLGSPEIAASLGF